MFDLLIRNGTIYDGEGNEPIEGDVGIVGDKISALGPLASAPARQTLDAGGAVVAPGFIDIHSHADLALLHNPMLPPKVLQGVTTEVVGNCGFSPAPTNPTVGSLLQKYVTPTLGETTDPWPWITFGDYESFLEAAKPSLNVAAHVGHGALRILTMGFDCNHASSEQVAVMSHELEWCLEAGAAGFSIGLIYAPGCFANLEEVEALCRVVARFHRIFAVHMRSESDNLLDSVRENLGIARRTQVHLHISHLKASGQANWNQLAQTLDLLDQARREGVEVTCDQYPYVAGSTTMTVLLPQWALEGGVDAMVERLGRREMRDRIRKDYERGIPGWDCLVRANGWENIVVSWAGKDSLKALEGKSLAAVSREMGKDPTETLFELLEELQGNASILVFQQSEENVAAAMRKEYVAVGSDGLHAGVKPHPRLYGTFPRILGRYVRELQVLTLPEAIRKMTSLPADLLGEHLRGRISQGCYADITVFNPLTVADTATFSDPVRFPAGIRHVLVNGVPVVVDGRHTEARPGRVLRSLASRPSGGNRGRHGGMIESLDRLRQSRLIACRPPSFRSGDSRR